MQAHGGVAGADDGGDGVFACDEGGVRGEGAAVGDNGGRSGEQWRPCRGGRFRDKDIAVAEPAEVLRAVHDAYRSGGAARRCRLPDDHTLANLPLTAGFLHGAVDHVPDQPGRPPERQRRGEAALALPQMAALTHDLDDRLSLASHTSGHFVAGAEEHVVGLLDRAGRDQVLAEQADTGAQDRPREGEVAGLFLSDDRIPLVDLEQLLELGQQPWLTGEGGPARSLGRGALLSQPCVLVATVSQSPCLPSIVQRRPGGTSRRFAPRALC